MRNDILPKQGPFGLKAIGNGESERKIHLVSHPETRHTAAFTSSTNSRRSSGVAMCSRGRQRLDAIVQVSGLEQAPH